MPTKALNNIQEQFCEVVKAIGPISDINHQPSIEYTSYSLTDSVANGHTDQSVNSGSFYIGLDLENYASADKSSIFAGYNSNTDDIYAVLTHTNTSSTATVRYDAFALFDEVIVIENNTAYVKF